MCIFDENINIQVVGVRIYDLGKIYRFVELENPKQKKKPYILLVVSYMCLLLLDVFVHINT